MTPEKWQELNERFGKAYGSYRQVKAKGETIRNAEKVFQMLDDALKIASILYDPKSRNKQRPMYKYEANSQDLPFGLAPAVLSELPDPADFPAESCATFYQSLVQSLLSYTLPSDFFLQSLNYANQLLPQFQDTHYFIDAVKFEELERKLRRKLVHSSIAAQIEHDKEAEHPLVLAYRQSLRRVADTYLRNRDYAGAVGGLIRELDTKYPEIPSISTELEYEKLFWLHYYNQMLGVMPPEQLLGAGNGRREQLSQEQLQRIQEFESPDIEGLEMRGLSVSLADGHVAPGSSTAILLSVNAALPEGEHKLGDYSIRVFPLSDPFSDLNFRFINQQAFVINGMPLAVLSPALWHTEGLSMIEISCPQPFHPDFEVNEDGSIGDSFTDELNKLHGDDYDPYLAKAIQLLRAVKVEGWPSRTELLSALETADSYFVGFFSPDGKTTHHIFRPLVKLSAFLAAKERFLSQFKIATERGHSNDSLKKLVFDETPMDADALLRYAKAVFRKLIVRESDRGEWWKTVWAEGKNFEAVRSEPDVGRDIANVVSHWFRIKGLAFDKEVSASGGSIDMLVTSAARSQLHRCGIELKYAHHANVLSGISTQLPDYMDDLDAEVGIFLVLWCKSDKFPQPSRYVDASDLVSQLRKEAPENKKISVIPVNASYRPPPSKRR